MYDTRTLKPRLQFDEQTVECPVVGCTTRVERQRKTFRREERFRCAEHDIYISASTYDHGSYTDNLLSPDAEDRALIERLLGHKRETARLGRERSEDALTFNVIRALERAQLLDGLLSDITGRPVTGAMPSYWSLNSETGQPDARLVEARAAFREVADRGTEPDVLIESDDTLFLIEAKLGSKNETTPTHVSSLSGYMAAADGWYSSVFTSDATTVAVEQKLYQLMRLWLLGTWIAERHAKRFVLVSLCAHAADFKIEAQFGQHIVHSDRHRFLRYTWERIGDLCRSSLETPAQSRIAEYLDHKTLGYDSVGTLQRAFQ